MKTSYLSYQEAIGKIQNSKGIIKFNSEQEEPYVTINTNTREIVIPDIMQNIGVLGDHKAETVWFKMDSYFDRESFLDLVPSENGTAKMQVVVQYINAMNEPYMYYVDNAYVTYADRLEETDATGKPYPEGQSIDTVIFPWELTNEVTKYSGIVRFAIRIYRIEDVDIYDTAGNYVGTEKKTTYVFNTQQGQFNILNGLNNADDTLGSASTLTPTQIEEIFSKISEIYTESMGITKDTEDGKVTAIITYDYSVLGKKPVIIAANGTKVELNGEIEMGTLLTGTEDDQLITLSTLDTEIDAESVNAVTNKAIAEKFETVEPLASISATSTNPVQSKAISAALQEIDEKFNNIEIDVDSALSETSTNPVQNKVIYAELEALREEMGGLSYVPIDIISFTTDPYYEKGFVMKSILIFDWELTKVPNTLTIEGLNADANTITPSQKGQIQTSSYPAMSEDTTFTLVATDAKGEDRMDFTVKFVLPIFYGVVTLDSTSTIDATILNSLTSVLSETRETMFTVAPGISEYIIFASPVDYGECSFKVGGFDGGFAKAATVSRTNTYNVSAEYYIYKSSNANLGTTTVQVI